MLTLSPPPLQQALTLTTQPPRGRRVLVVDDNVDTAESLALLLQLYGHDVRTAYDGASALAVAQESKPEVVLLDIGMPGMSGYAVAPRLRQLPGLGKVQLIALTGVGKEDGRTREAGFDAHFVKPVLPETLLAVIANR